LGRVPGDEPLFPGTVTFGYSEKLPELVKLFQTLHYGTAFIQVKPRDILVTDAPHVITVSVYEPPTLGPVGPVAHRRSVANNTKYDKRLAKLAHNSGIPPQYIKGQIEQETADTDAKYFNPKSWRYEPITVDYGDPYSSRDPHSVSKSNPSASQQNALDLINKDTYRDYALPSGPRLCPGTAGCPSDLDDYSPRNSLSICDPSGGPGGTLRNIQRADMPTARAIVQNNPRQNFDQDQPDPSPQNIAPCGTPPPPPGGRRRPSSPGVDQLNFTAQTPLASSYGLLQLIPIYIMDVRKYLAGGPYYWSGNNGRFNPSLLFDTDQNLTRQDDAERRNDPRAGAGTLYMGVMKDVILYRSQNAVGAVPVFTNPAEFEGYLSAAFSRYPGFNAQYGPNVIRYAQDYTPQKRAATIFQASSTETCNAPVITAQSQDTIIRRGLATYLSVDAASEFGLVYDWYSGTADRPVRVGSTDTNFLRVEPQQTTSYWAVVTNGCGSSASAQIRVSVTAACGAPAILEQPSIAAITDGNATLTASASGGLVVYEWFRDTASDTSTGTSLPSENIVSSGITPSFVAPRETTPVTYRLRARNSCGATISSPITVPATVCNAPHVDTPPSAQTVTEGTHVRLEVTASGSGTLSYQWFNGAPGDEVYSVKIDGAVSRTYEFDAQKPGGLFWVKVSNACGSDVSRAALVTVVNRCDAPAVAPLVAPLFTGSNETKMLTALASGTALHYQWFLNGADAGVDTATISIPAPSVPLTYAVRVYNDCGETTSNTIVVQPPAPGCSAPSIRQPLVAPTFTEASETRPLSVNASGSALHYQWLLNGVDQGVDAPSIQIAAPSIAATYAVRVYNTCGEATSNTVTVQPPAPVCIAPALQKPLVAPVFSNASETKLLTVDATGTALHYRWFRNGAELSIDSATISLTAPAFATTYAVRVSNDCGEVTTNFITVEPAPPSCVSPSITAQSNDRAIEEGQSVALSVVATGSDVIYRWQEFIGSTWWAMSLSGSTVSLTPAAGQHIYRAIASNDCGSVASAEMHITVAGCAPAITRQPVAPVFTAARQTATIAVEASGANPRYQWLSSTTGADFTPLYGATASSLLVSASTTGTWYSATVTTDCGEVTTTAVYVAPICSAPRITGSTRGTTIAPGGSAILGISAEGFGVLSYQWYERVLGSDTFSRIDGATFSSLSVSPLTTTDYYAEVRNDCGSVNSQPVRINVQEPPACTAVQITQQPQGRTIAPGTVVSVSVAATGSNLRVQWYEYLPELDREYAIVNGADTWTLTAQPHVSGYYLFARVWNACSEQRSQNAVFTLTQ
ncbi:MAG: hypothetical protein M3Q69_13320, partial [Acidobacteriota bacterium]|nr:hypothetical protein [Acidobacteriota bacterium]